MTTIVEEWFPVPIYCTNDTISNEENQVLINRVLEIHNATSNGASGWFCNTYNTLGSYELQDDLVFNSILNVVDQHMIEFSKIWGSDVVPHCSQSWVNVSGEGGYQEFHTHPGAVYSAVYYLSCPPGSGKIIFKNPMCPDMLPPPNLEQTKFSREHCMYEPMVGNLIIFRSFMQHMVELGTNKEPRMTLAFNYGF